MSHKYLNSNPIPLINSQFANPEDNGLNGAALFEEALVNLKEEPPAKEVLVYVGYDYYQQRVDWLTRGEMSCIVGPEKTKKSYTVSLIEAAYIGGNTDMFTSHIMGNRIEDRYIIHLDTEQGLYYAHRTFQRIEKLTGAPYPYFVPLVSRTKNPNERIEILKYILTQSPFRDKIDVIFIDGIADLTKQVNDEESANELSSLLMKWTGEHNIHICVVIHKTFSVNKATGHLGSSIQKKAESVLMMTEVVDPKTKEVNWNTVKVVCIRARGMPFKPFYLSINAVGLPYTHDEEDETFDDIQIKWRRAGKTIERYMPYKDSDL